MSGPTAPKFVVTFGPKLVGAIGIFLIVVITFAIGGIWSPAIAFGRASTTASKPILPLKVPQRGTFQ